MEKELLNKDLGKELDLKIDFKDGKLALSLVYDGKGGDASIGLSLEPDYFLDKLKAAIPGQIDDTVIDVLKAAFKL